MYFYPTIVIDEFFKDPLKIREYALSLDYGPGSNFSGERTDNIFNFNPGFAESVCKKILMSCGIPFLKYKAELHFHLTGTEFGDHGWPHADFDHDDDTKFASVTYLNIEPEGLENGTSVFKVKNFANLSNNGHLMQESFTSRKDNYEERKKHFEHYEENIRVGGLFNRTIAYDSRRPHCGNNYFGTKKEDKRLTMLAFFKKIEVALPNGFTPIVYADMHSVL